MPNGPTNFSINHDTDFIVKYENSSIHHGDDFTNNLSIDHDSNIENPPTQTEDTLYIQEPQQLQIQHKTGKMKNQLPGNTTLCKFFIQGHCKRGIKCNFVHEEINIGDYVEWNDKMVKEFLLARVTNLCDYDMYGNYNFCIQAILYLSGQTVIDYPHKFRKYMAICHKKIWIAVLCQSQIWVYPLIICK